MKTAIVGGGAAGFFLAINLKEMCPEMQVTIFEKSKKVLAKVEVSGGGRCNCTNSFEAVTDLSQVYPRGHRLLKRLFQDSHTIINLFLAEAKRHGIDIRTQHKIESLDELKDYDFKVITTGGGTASMAGVPVTSPVPSLFTFSIEDEALRALMGTVIEDATASIPGTKLKSNGPLLITHWGMSGPAILKLSSYAARDLYEHNYQMPLAVNWTSQKEPEIQQELHEIIIRHPQKQIATIRPFGLPSRLWDYLVQKTLGERAQNRWQNLNPKELCNDQYQIAGRAAFKDEFVTCGGIDLSGINPNTLEAKTLPQLYFAGEVLDIDGITGGFNFQAAWTTAYVVSMAITQQVRCSQSPSEG